MSKNKMYYTIPVALSPAIFASIAVLLDLLRVDPESALIRLMRLVDKGLFYERWGREIASKTGDEDVVDEDVDYLKSLSTLYLDLHNLFNDVYEECGQAWCRTLVEQLSKTVDTIHSNLYTIRYALNQVRWVAKRRDKISRHLPHHIDTKKGIISYSNVADCVLAIGSLVSGDTNRECIWVLEKLKPAEEYTFAELINDVTACHHTLMDYIRMHLDPELTEVYSGVYAKYARPELVELCKAWRSSANVLYKGGDGIYAGEDYLSTYCVVWGNRAELRVGSSPGHATHVELTDDRVVVRYYDTDEVVHLVLAKIAERFGFAPTKHKPREYTEFRMPLKHADRFFSYVLPSATTMDLRISCPECYWGRTFRSSHEYHKVYNELLDKYGVLIAEVEMYVDALRRFGLLRD